MQKLLAMVSKKVIINKRIGFMFRDHPVSQMPEFSGWIVNSGTETEEEENDETQYQLICIECLIDINKQVLNIIRTPPRCAFCLNDEGILEQVYDFDWASYDEV